MSVSDGLPSWLPSLGTLRTPLEAGAFWSAIVLPFLHVPLLFTGLETTGQLLTFLGLLGLNVIAFIVGRDYNR